MLLRLRQSLEETRLPDKWEMLVFVLDNSPGRELEDIFTQSGSRFTKNTVYKICYKHTGKNLGYGKAHNLALKRALSLRSKYHLVLNPDIYFGPDELRKIIEYMDAYGDIGLLMPQILYPHGERQYLCKLIPGPFDLILRRFLSSWVLARQKSYYYELRWVDYNRIMEVPYVSGCFMFLRTKALADAGLFDERFFMYFEDLDLTRRIGKHWRTIYYPGAKVYHYYNKESYRDLRLLWIHIWLLRQRQSLWGWWGDHERKATNQRILTQFLQ